MFKRFVWLLAMLLCCCNAASAGTVAFPADLTHIGDDAFAGDASLTGVLALDEGVLSVGERAFADTGLYALGIPESCGSVPVNVLDGAQAAYLYVPGENTAIDTADPGTVPYVFGADDSAADVLGDRYVNIFDSLLQYGGIYYRADGLGAYPLCPIDPSILGDVLILPQEVLFCQLAGLEQLVMPGCEDVLIIAPAGMPIPAGLNARSVCTLTASAITAEAPLYVGETVPFSLTVEGCAEGCGPLSFRWTFHNGQTAASFTTDMPSCGFTIAENANIRVEVTVTDTLCGGKTTMDGSFAVASDPEEVKYRALLVGNTYPGTINELKGCDNDVAGIQAMLGTMSRSGYAVTARLNLDQNSLLTSISTCFAGADENDVSLFYFSGHGTESGSIVGTSGLVTPYMLRKALDQIPGTKIVLLDCCYSGAFISKSGSAGASAEPSAFNSAVISAFASYSRGDQDLASGGYQVLTSCRKDQTSLSLDGGEGYYFGLFTYGVCFGSGYDSWLCTHLPDLPADLDENGAISLLEAYNGAVDQVYYMNREDRQSIQYYGDEAFILWAR